jgi:hypothetical protein
MNNLPLAKPMPRAVEKAAQDALEQRWWEVCKALIFHRDDRRCRACGALGTDPHHLLYRSLGGPDTTQNVITLCPPCHRAVQEHKTPCEFVNANWPRGVLFGRRVLLEGVGRALAAARIDCEVVVVIDREGDSRTYEYPLPLPDAIPLYRKDAVRALVLGKNRDAEGRAIYREVTM